MGLFDRLLNNEHKELKRGAVDISLFDMLRVNMHKEDDLDTLHRLLRENHNNKVSRLKALTQITDILNKKLSDHDDIDENSLDIIKDCIQETVDEYIDNIDLYSQL